MSDAVAKVGSATAAGAADHSEGMSYLSTVPQRIVSLYVPLALIVSLFFLRDFSSTPNGLALAVASGAIASGCGYVIWYAALAGLTGTRAATVQLTVPVIAAFGGVVLLSEQITMRLLIASVATLGGVAIVVAQRAVKTAQS